MTRRYGISIFLLWLAATISASGEPTGDRARGKDAFAKFGCYECHGYVGQGALAFGPPLAPRPVPYDAFAAHVRTPRGQMPPYSEKILSESVLADIYAYVASIPAPPPVSQIKLLSLGHVPPSTPKNPGATAYMQYCSACHGAPDAGSASAPTLPGRFRGKNPSEIVAIVKNPPPRMPRLFPDAIGDKDVAAVANYLTQH